VFIFIALDCSCKTSYIHFREAVLNKKNNQFNN